MNLRFSALFLFLIGLCLGLVIVLSTGANSVLKQALGVLIPSLAGLGFAIAWWRKSLRPW